MRDDPYSDGFHRQVHITELGLIPSTRILLAKSNHIKNERLNHFVAIARNPTMLVLIK